MAKNFKEIGNDVDVAFSSLVGSDSGSGEFPVTEASYSEDASISETQFNTGLGPSNVVTGVSYSGSFAHSGANTELRDALFRTARVDEEVEDGVTNYPTSAPIEVDWLTITDSQTEYRFENVTIETRDKDFPADDRTEVSYDFMAERLVRSPVDDAEELGLDRQDRDSTPGFN